MVRYTVAPPKLRLEHFAAEIVGQLENVSTKLTSRVTTALEESTRQHQEMSLKFEALAELVAETKGMSREEVLAAVRVLGASIVRSRERNRETRG